MPKRICTISRGALEQPRAKLLALIDQDTQGDIEQCQAKGGQRQKQDLVAWPQIGALAGGVESHAQHWCQTGYRAIKTPSTSKFSTNATSSSPRTVESFQKEYRNIRLGSNEGASTFVAPRLRRCSRSWTNAS